MANASTAVAQLTPAEKTKKIEKLQADNRELRTQNTNLEQGRNKALSFMAKEGVQQIALYGGFGATIGALGGFYLHTKLKEYMGEDSYVGLLGTAALGVVVIVATPSILKVSRNKIAEQAPLQAALYGLGVGLVAQGAYQAYNDWPQA